MIFTTNQEKRFLRHSSKSVYLLLAVALFGMYLQAESCFQIMPQHVQNLKQQMQNTKK